LSHWLAKWMLNRRPDPVDLAADLARYIPGDEVVDLVDPREHADLLIREVDVGMNEELLRELDDRAVRPADVLARAARRAQARYDVDDEVDLVGQQRIQVDERLGREPWEADVRCQLRRIRESPAMLREELAELSLSVCILREDALARNFRDVRRLEMHLQGLREAVHETGQLDT